MNNDTAQQSAQRDTEYAWLREGSLPHSREDRIAEAVAAVALVFSLAAGLMIAMLPVSANAGDAMVKHVAPLHTSR
jgi:hypothetical protein